MTRCLTTLDVASTSAPPAPTTLEQLGLPVDLVQHLLLKTLYLSGDLTGVELATHLGLASSAIEPCLEYLIREHLCEIAAGPLPGRASCLFRLAEAGRARAVQAFEQNRYVGPAPVPLAQYLRYLAVFKQAMPLDASRESVRTALSHLVMSDVSLDRIGMAVNAGPVLFLHGAAGNGKTAIAKALRSLLPGTIAIPYALEVEGHIIRLFDAAIHERAPLEPGLEWQAGDRAPDRRWVQCLRPLVLTGGELTVDALDLQYRRAHGCYQAPVQLVASGGILVVDDFGRQRSSPRELLSRWIAAFENQQDHLTLATGHTVTVPFTPLVVFATNLNPASLADEAFLTRIHHKIQIDDPTAEDFAAIFERHCRAQDIPFDVQFVEHMFTECLHPRQIPLRRCQPRDLIDLALALARHLDQPRRLTPELLSAACLGYFVAPVDSTPHLAPSTSDNVEHV